MLFLVECKLMLLRIAKRVNQLKCNGNKATPYIGFKNVTNCLLHKFPYCLADYCKLRYVNSIESKPIQLTIKRMK